MKFGYASFFLICGPLCLLLYGPAAAELHEGIAVIGPVGSWDFSDSVAVEYYEGDLAYDVTRRLYVGDAFSPYWFWTNTPAKIAYAPSDTTYEELTTAPEDTSLYTFLLPACQLQTYVIRTKEWHYAKFKMLSFYPITLEYTYQDDGSRIIAKSVPVGATTWGRIKALYN